MTPRHRGAAAFAGALLILGFVSQPAANPEASQKTMPDPSLSRGKVEVYTGSAACATCHRSIYAQYKKTAMGRSITPASSWPDLGLSLPAHFTNDRLDRSFDVSVQDGKLLESEYALGPDSAEIFRDTRPIAFMIGAGVNGYGPVVQQDDYLFQAPLSFYSKPGTWGPSPGYESTDLGFNRPILPGCIFCHVGRADPVAGANGKYADPPFSEQAIGCENCHGAGAPHIAAMSHKLAASKHTQIVNPARLSSRLADNICMACHQTGDVRVLKPGKTYQDVLPGRPLDETLSILIVPPKRESPPDADHVEHYYSMTLSKCYRASSGRMSCISCHDPHVQPTAAEAPAYFRTRCLACHTNQSCKIPLQTRLNRSPANDCVSCHMPKRDIQVISHSSATNHRILAKPDEPFPDSAFHQSTSGLPDLILLNATPGQDEVPPPLTLLQAYGELSADKPSYVAPYLEVLSRLEKSSPDIPLVQAAVGRRELKSGNYASAVDHLQRALGLNPAQAATCADLADALTQLGRKREAVSWLDKSVELDPYNPFTQRTLVVRLIDLKQYARARAALEHYVTVFPQDTFMRQMLAKARAQPVQ